MAIEKVGVSRKYHGPVPIDESGNPLPRSEWPRRRTFRWAVRWFGSDGKRYSRTFCNPGHVIGPVPTTTGSHIL